MAADEMDSLFGRCLCDLLTGVMSFTHPIMIFCRICAPVVLYRELFQGRTLDLGSRIPDKMRFLLYS
jgi:hypothetical protein